MEANKLIKNMAPEDKKEELARRILMKARKFGVNIQSPTILEWDQEKSGR